MSGELTAQTGHPFCLNQNCLGHRKKAGYFKKQDQPKNPVLSFSLLLLLGSSQQRTLTMMTGRRRKDKTPHSSFSVWTVFSICQPKGESVSRECVHIKKGSKNS